MNKHIKCFDKECLKCIQTLIDKSTANVIRSDNDGNVVINGDLQVNGTISYETVNVDSINANSINVNTISIQGDVGNNGDVLTSNGTTTSWQQPTLNNIPLYNVETSIELVPIDKLLPIIIDGETFYIQIFQKNNI